MWQAFYLAWTRWDMVRRVRKHGWTGLYIRPDTPVDRAPFSYSVGFWETAKAPEVIMFGFDPAASNQVLHEAYRQLMEGELKFADMAPWDLWGDDGPALCWRKVHKSQIRREHFNAAIWYRERQGLSRWELEAFQLFITDPGGKFPWEDGFDTNYRPQQELLYLPFIGPPDED